MTGPSRASLRELTELGRWLDATVELEQGESRLTPSGRALLLWSPASKALVVLLGFKLPRPRAGELPEQPAHVYSKWTRGRDASKVREASIELPAGRWRDLGPALSIAYDSDKFHQRGASVHYEHEFEGGVRTYQLGTGRQRVLAWRGGRLRITPDGIEG
jgi:hypothetical protein